MNEVIIFGNLDTAELAHFYLANDSNCRVRAFSLNEKYLREGSFLGLPVVPFEDVEKRYPPSDYDFFVPMTGRNMNRNRELIYLETKKKGYKLISYISSRATVLTQDIGENCFILEDNTLQPFSKIGDNVLLWSGNHIGHHSRIENHVTITSHVVVSGHCRIDSYAYIGVNATLRDQITIGEGTFVAMGSTVTANTDPWGVYRGNPAKAVPNMHSSKLRI